MHTKRSHVVLVLNKLNLVLLLYQREAIWLVDNGWRVSRHRLLTQWASAANCVHYGIIIRTSIQINCVSGVQSCTWRQF